MGYTSQSTVYLESWPILGLPFDTRYPGMYPLSYPTTGMVYVSIVLAVTQYARYVTVYGGLVYICGMAAVSLASW